MKKIVIFLLVLLVILLVLSATIAVLQKNVPLGEKIGVVRVEGPILDSKNTVDEIEDYAKNQSVRAIVLRVDSPGGAVAPSQEIYEEVRKAAAKKKVVVSMGSVAASGGYYISAPASRILANPGTLTGSIGVIMEIPNIEGLMSKVGLKTEVIKSGRHKDMASIFRGIGPEERAILQNVLDDVHDQFTQAVADARNIPLAEVQKLSDGRVFTGRQAVDIKLVDELGSFEDAVKVAAKLAGIEGEPTVVEKKEKTSLIDFLRGELPKQLSDVFPTVKLKYVFAP